LPVLRWKRDHRFKLEITETTENKATLDKATDEIPSSSIIVAVATDCPLLPHQLKRLAKRVSLGIARVGGIGSTYSGDIFLAFSTALPGGADDFGLRDFKLYPDNRMNPLLEATVQATEEAIVNCLVAAEDMVGINFYRVYAIPHERLKAVLKKYNRLVE
jgi:L-aminopeptidase/D-esterase-like protein